MTGDRTVPPYTVRLGNGAMWSSHLMSIDGRDGARVHYKSACSRHDGCTVVDGNGKDVTHLCR